MVLPKNLADVVRGLAENGGGGNALRDVHIHTTDAASFMDLVRRNRSGFVRELQLALRGI